MLRTFDVKGPVRAGGVDDYRAVAGRLDHDRLLGRPLHADEVRAVEVEISSPMHEAFGRVSPLVDQDDIARLDLVPHHARGPACIAFDTAVVPSRASTRLPQMASPSFSWNPSGALPPERHAGPVRRSAASARGGCGA